MTKAGEEGRAGQGAQSANQTYVDFCELHMWNVNAQDVLQPCEIIVALFHTQKQT